MQHYREIAGLTNERNNCSVIATTIATGEHFGKIDQQFLKHGRKRGRATPSPITFEVFRENGYILFDVTERLKRRGIKTPISLERQGDPDKIYLVLVRRHIFCFRDGKVQDWSANRKNRILRIWEVRKRGRNNGREKTS